MRKTSDGFTPPLVSVIVPHYGDPVPTLAICHQLSEQQGARIEIIVADDASPVPIRVPDHIRLVRRERNGGFAANVNSGLAEATGDLCLVLNSDMELGDTAVAELVEAAGPFQPCLAAPAIMATDARWEESRHRWPTPMRSAVALARPVPKLMRFGWVRNWLMESRPVMSDGPTPADWISGAAFMLPTSLLRDVGGMNDAYFMYGEDVDLQRRLHSRGIPSLMFRSVEMTHIGGGSTDPTRAEGWSLRARWVYAESHGFARSLHSLLMVTALVNLMWNLAAKVAGKDVNVAGELRHDVRRALGRSY